MRGIVGDEWVYTAEHQLRTYESDGLLQYTSTPACAVLPNSTDEVQQIVQACAREEVPWVARGAGSGLSGGALPVKDGVLLVLSRMKRILEIDLDNGRVCVEPGVTNANVSAAVGPEFFYPPDPSLADRLLDRRQRRRELRRRALLQVRLHDQLRHRPGARAGRRRAGADRRLRARSARLRPARRVRG